MIPVNRLPFALNETIPTTKIVVDKTGLTPKQYATKVVSQVMDPEIPILSLQDLGVIQAIHAPSFDRVSVDITPTYSGCPATVAINISVEVALLDAGFTNVSVRTVLSPAWSTDYISAEGRQKLKQYGIAPPQKAANKGALFHTETVTCPHCNSHNTQQISQFGSTACKALYKCHGCLESFEYFKCI